MGLQNLSSWQTNKSGRCALWRFTPFSQHRRLSLSLSLLPSPLPLFSLLEFSLKSVQTQRKRDDSFHKLCMIQKNLGPSSKEQAKTGLCPP